MELHAPQILDNDVLQVWYEMYKIFFYIDHTLLVKNLIVGTYHNYNEIRGLETPFVCGVRGCHISDLSEKIVCSNCHIAFCLKHRLPADHKCSKIPQVVGTSEKDTKQKQQEEDFTSILKKKIEETIKKYSSATPTTRKQYVNNMKSTATGDQKVPADKRFYLEVLYPVAMNIQPKLFLFDQSKRFGQVLDHVADAGKIKNENKNIRRNRKKTTKLKRKEKWVKMRRK